MYGSIQKKLIIYIIPIVLIVLILGYNVSLVNSRKIVELEIYETIEAKHDEQTYIIEGELSKFKSNTDNFASTIGSTYQYLDVDIYNKIITDRLSNDHRYRSVGVWFEPYTVDKNNERVSTIVENINGELTTNKYYYSGTLDYLNVDLYTKAKALNQSFFTEAYYNNITNSYAIIYITPINNSTGEFIGCVSASFNISELKTFVDKYTDENVDFYIIDNNGTYVANSNLELVKSRINILDDTEGSADTFRNILNTETGVLTYDENGETHYLYYDTVLNLGWKLVYDVPESYIHSHLIKLTTIDLVICILTIILLIVLILYVSNKFVHKPLQLLLGEFDNISHNDYDSNVPTELLKSNTEFSAIGTSLANMKSSLAKFQMDLQFQNSLYVENQKALNDTVDYVNTIINALPIMMFIFDRKGNCVEMLGKAPFVNRPAEFYKGKNYRDLAYEDYSKSTGIDEFLENIKTIDYSDGVVIHNVSMVINGTVEYIEHSLTLCADDMVISLARTITDTINHIHDIEYLSDFDELTDVYNSRYFSNKLKDSIDSCDLPISIIISDVNGFKAINDRFGYDVGDQLLVDITTALNNINVRNKTVARVAGDEFAVILPNTTKVDAESIIENINTRCLLTKVAKVPFTISYGVDTVTSEKDSLFRLIKSVEELLYKQKVYTSSGKKDNSVGLINSLLHAKNKREQLHSNRVSELCLQLAKALGWSQLDQNKISTAGLLHDIGKIGISEAILNKPDKLTDEEYKEMCTHPEIGYRILQSFENMKELSEYAYAHHEKWDGTGYPRGLVGSAIPLEARILSIADSYDAMTSSRSYREGMSKEAAIAELIRCKNTQFDPDLVDIFIEKVLPENADDIRFKF